MAGQKNADILVVGGGVPGLTLAALLGQAGLNVTVADRHPAPALKSVRADGRTAALMQGSVNILKSAGAWDKAVPFAEKLATLRIIDDSGAGAPVEASFEAGEIGLDAFGLNTPNEPLRAALGEAVKTIRTVTLLQASLARFETDAFGVSAALDNGQSVRAKLIVGADGRGSMTRELAGIKVWQRDYGQQAITCLIDHAQPHSHISTEFHRPSGPFTLVPLPGNRSSVVWVDYDDRAAEFMALSPHAFARALQERSRDLLGAIEVASAPRACPLAALKAAKLTAPRTALIAEAAHVLHPLGAQGLNLSLRDAAVLAEIIVDAARVGLDPGSAGVLARYEARRRQDVLSRVIGTDGLNRMVSNDLSVIRGLRRMGLKTISNITPLREFAMHQGLAPGLDDSRLAKGGKL